MDIYRRMSICAVVGIIVIAGCGDEKGFKSLEAFYGAEGTGASTSSGGSSGGSSGTPSAGSCGVSTSSLLAYLPFEGDLGVRGGSSFSFLRSRNVTTASSTPSFVTGKRGTALSGADQIFYTANSSVASSSWTFCAWVRMGGSNYMGLLLAPPVEVGVGDPSRCGDGSLAPYVWSRDLGCFSPSSVSLSPSQWSFICVVNDPSEGAVRFVIDGERETGSPMVPLQIDAGSVIGFGGGPADASTAIDEVSLWARALDDEEIAKLSGAGSACAVIEESR